VVTALIFDCDGVLGDTERFGHLPAFNRTFEEFGLPVRWDEEEYGEKLRIGGGKERMASLFDDPAFVAEAGIPDDDGARRELLAQWHKTKTVAFTELVGSGSVPARPGIARVIREALDAGWTVAVASTSAEPSVRAVLEHAVGARTASGIPVFAGDVVPAKKPDPAIYLLALDELGVDRGETIVVEDSRNGLLAATRAGLRCVVTVNGYTRDEDFAEAALVVSDLGDPDGDAVEVLADRVPVGVGHHVTLADLEAVLTAPAPPAPAPGHPATGEVSDPGDPGEGGAA
jgi:HAD superfamily hydrolase (TIGR01509 family)